MALILATVSETLGPTWASMLNTIFQQLDLHDHSTGNGAQVTPAGILINAALDMVNNALQNAKYVGLDAQADGTAVANGGLYRIGTNLYWRNAAGASVQLTSGSSLAAVGSGEITASVIAAYPYTVLVGDAQKVLIVDSASARTLTLPAATTAMFLMVKDGEGLAATNNITITPDGTDLIDGANDDYLIDANYKSIGLVSDGVSKWYVV